MCVLGPALSPFLAPHLTEANRPIALPWRLAAPLLLAPPPMSSHLIFPFSRDAQKTLALSAVSAGLNTAARLPQVRCLDSVKHLSSTKEKRSPGGSSSAQHVWADPGVPALRGPLLPPTATSWPTQPLTPATAHSQGRFSTIFTHPSLLEPVKSQPLVPRILSSICFLKNKKIEKS